MGLFNVSLLILEVTRVALTRGEMPQSMPYTLGATPEQLGQSSPIYLWSDSGAGHAWGSDALPSQSPSTLGATPRQDSLCVMGAIPFTRAPSPRRAQQVVDHQNRTGNQLSTALVFLCGFSPPFLPAVLLAGVVFGMCAPVLCVRPLFFFLSSSLAPFRRGALLRCLRPLVVPARLVLLRWFFLQGGRRSQNRSRFAGAPFASYYSGMTLGGRICTNGTSSCTICCPYMKSFVLVVKLLW